MNSKYILKKEHEKTKTQKHLSTCNFSSITWKDGFLSSNIMAAVSIWIIIPLRCLCRLPALFLTAVCFFPPSSDFPVTVASSHQALQRDYYHTVLFVLWRRRHSNKSRNSLLLNHIANFSYLFLHAFWLHTDLIRIFLNIPFEKIDFLSH